MFSVRSCCLRGSFNPLGQAHTSMDKNDPRSNTKPHESSLMATDNCNGQQTHGQLTTDYQLEVTMKNQNQILPRRCFLKHASAFALVLPAVEVCARGLISCGPTSSAEQKAESPRANVPAKIAIISDKEPGEPLIVSGTIFAPDGQKPLEGITLYVYQTDTTGVYSTSGAGGDNRNTRIHGVMRTGPDGRYEFRTIRPASYPGTQTRPTFTLMFPALIIPSTDR